MKRILMLSSLFALLILVVFFAVGCKDEAEGNRFFRLYCEKYGYSGTEDEWLEDLENGRLNSSVSCLVTFNPMNGSESFTQTVSEFYRASAPDGITRAGYKLCGWFLNNGSSEEKWDFDSFSVIEDVELYAVWDYATKELPIVDISTSGAAINSKEAYTDMIFSVSNCDYEIEGASGGIRLRGNSTGAYEKKPYRIKFDMKQSLFGLDAAKSWVLLAEYLDPSGLHNHAAFTMAGDMPGLSFTPTPNKVNLYLNGNFMGLYTLCEQIQENAGRMDIELQEITPDMTELSQFNFFIAMDASSAVDPTLSSDQVYYIKEHRAYFELRYPEKEQFVSDEQFYSFYSQLKSYTKELLDAFSTRDKAYIDANININSLVDFLLLDQLMGERDHMSKSFNMYYTAVSDNPSERGRLSFGPAWDYDWSLHTEYTGAPNQSYTVTDAVIYSNVFFQCVVNIPEYYGIVKERYWEYARGCALDYAAQIDSMAGSMSNSLKMNAERWYSSFSSDMTDKNIEYLKAFLERRVVLFDELYKLSDS